MHTFLTGTRFILLWVLGTIFALLGAAVVAGLLALGGMLLGGLITGRSGGDPNPTTLFIVLVILLSLLGSSFGLLFGAVQKALLRQMTGDPWRGWLVTSLLGGVTGVLLTFFLIVYQVELLLTLTPLEIVQAVGLQLFVVPFACLGLAQWPVVAQEVRNSWLWALANIVAGVVMYGLIVGGLFAGAASLLIGLGLLLLLAAAPGIVTGFTMLSLLLFQRRSTW
ncbi:MAG: hypothetical protein KC496_01745 [Anaerolineae bacterium]|nr:hypothetical protein [Anaerolineae bacterium]